jgi:hypothetical protein
MSEKGGHGFVVHKGTVPEGMGEMVTNSSPPGYLSATEKGELRAASRLLDFPALEEVYVEAIRKVSRRSRGVGPHCMCIRFSLGGEPSIACTFRPFHDDHGPQDPGAGAQYEAYLPWVIMPGESQAPAFLGGSGDLQILDFGPFKVIQGIRPRGSEETEGHENGRIPSNAPKTASLITRPLV